MNKQKIPTMVIFGRTNVGKSTLFNTLIEKKKALTSNLAGTTRDSNIETASWNDFDFEIIDTGGIMDEIQNASNKKIKGLLKEEKEAEKIINLQVQKQALAYLKEADIIVFLVDGKMGLMPQDKEMARIIKKMVPAKDQAKIFLVVNKVDSQKIAPNAAEFNKLGLGKPLQISAATGMGTGDFLDLVIKFFKKNKIKSKKPDQEKSLLENINVCLLGKPNVGKSSLFNKLLGEEKVIVSSFAHTTREPNNTEIIFNNHKITFVDTAGISKKGKKMPGLEKSGMEKTLITLQKASVVLLIIDISQKITHQDAKLVEEIVDAGKSLIIIANKWDLIPEKDTKKYKEYIYSKLPFATWAPIQFTSALTGLKVNKVIDLILELDAQRKIKLGDSQLAKFLNTIVKIHKPAKAKGIKKPRIYEFSQTGVNPPRFIIRIGSRDTLDASYARFVKNQLRKKYGFIGSPISIRVITNKKVHSLSV